MNQASFDLDALAPTPKIVILGGKQYEVMPPTMAALAALMAVGSKLQELSPQPDDSQEVQAERMAQADTIIPQLKEALSLIAPWVNDEGIDLSLQQLLALFQFAADMATPPEKQILADAGLSPVTDGGEKGGDLQPQLPTSSESSQVTPPVA